MKKRERREKREIEHRGYDHEVSRNFEMEMNVVRKVPKSYYSRQGGMKVKKQYSQTGYNKLNNF